MVKKDGNSPVGKLDTWHKNASLIEVKEYLNTNWMI